MKKRIFHGNVNDVQFNDRDAMLNYVQDLVNNGEEIHSYSSYYQMIETTDDAEQPGLVETALHQLDISSADIDEIVNANADDAEALVEDCLTDRMLALLTVMDAATDEQAAEVSKRYDELYKSMMECFEPEKERLESEYEDNIQQGEAFESLLKQLNEKINENADTRHRLLQYSNIYDTIIGWCDAMKDIIEDYKSKKF